MHSWLLWIFRVGQECDWDCSRREPSELAVNKSSSFQCLCTQGLAWPISAESAACHSPALSSVCSTETCFFEAEPEKSVEAALDDVAFRAFVGLTAQVRCFLFIASCCCSAAPAENCDTRPLGSCYRQAGGKLNRQAKNVELAMRLSSTSSAIFVR
jgi:hypothetical protein